MRLPKLFWLITGKQYVKLFHIHTGFDDRCLFWYCHGKVMDVMFVRIN
jgi:hypothetical protein